VKKIFTLVLNFTFLTCVFAQRDSSNQNCHFRISLLTCTPGNELYSTFGHSALRVLDSSSNTDIIYNYGTFDFDDPNFYSKFTRGKLLYYVSLERFDNFVQQYQYDQRGIVEQVISLSCEEKQRLVYALHENAKEENKYYKYDFINDNCTTRLRDIVLKNLSGTVFTKNIRPRDGTTFRDLIHEYLDKSYQYWSKFGIDMLLGTPLDKKISNAEAMFLPDYLLKGFENTSIGEKPLVLEKNEILSATVATNKSPLLSPFLIFAILFVVVVLLSLGKSAARFLDVFDFILFFLAGALGILMLFMWFGTDHPECKNNFNVVWAFPLHFVVVFLFYKKWDWLRYYFLVNSILLVLFLIAWKWLPQEINSALLPVVCLLLFRSLARYKKFSYAR
jgi:hypothetical protein